MAEINKISLGKTDIDITPIGLGTWQFSEGRYGAMGQWAPISEELTNEIIQTALQGGINWFDTAEIYGGGRSEKALAKGLQNYGVKNGEVIIATKWFPLFRWASSIKKTIERRKAALSPYHIDLYQIHFPAAFSSIEAQASNLADLIENGEIKAAGVSNFSADQMLRAHQVLIKRGFCLASNQVAYNLLNRKIEVNGILEKSKELSITIIAYSPLEMGLLTGKFHKDPSLLEKRPFARREKLKRKIKASQELINTLEDIANAHQATVSQVALNWLISFNAGNVVAIPGASKPSHARESAEAMNLKLKEDEIEIIDQLSQQFRN